MVATVTINPLQTSNAAGSFNVTSSGFIQGTALDQPAIRNALAGGVLGSGETIPMWGGVGINEAVPTPDSTTLPHTSLGGIITRATNVTANTAKSLTGFSVFDQDHAMITSPQSPVPLSPSGGEVNFYRLGSGARIAVKCDPTFAASLEAGSINQQVSWDFTAQELVPYVAAYLANVITAASWAATGGGQVTFTTTTNHGVAVGDVFDITGMVPAGYNGTYTAIAGTATNQLVAAQPVNPGASTTQGTLAAGGGALNVEVLEVQVANSMTVVYDPVTGFATWNRSGSCAIILI
jgi:hypothetical protein